MKIHENYKLLSACLCLILATTTVYWQVQFFGAIDLDDNIYVTENEHVQSGLTREGVMWAITTSEGGQWMPVTWISLMIDYQFFGDDLGRFHLQNLIFHTINSVLLLLCLNQLTGTLWRSAFVAGLFALHPLHVESVAWLTERKDVLSGLFTILTIVAYHEYVKKSGRYRYSLILIFFTLALMAKPASVTVPLLLLVIDYWPLNRLTGWQRCRLAGNEEPGRKGVIFPIIEKIPLFLIASAISLKTMYTAQAAGAIMHQFPIISRIIHAMQSYTAYMGKMIWPLNLGVFYPHPLYEFSITSALFSGAILVLISFSALRLAKNYQYFAIGWFWFIVALIPNIGLVQAGTQGMADRFTYIPLIGLYIVVSWGLADLTKIVPFGKVLGPCMAGSILIGYSLLTVTQVSYWRNSETLFEHTLRVTEDNRVIHNNFGLGLQNKGNADEAIRHYLKALSIKPDYSEAHYNLGNQYWDLGKAEAAEHHFRFALKIKPDYASAFINLGIVARETGRLDEAIGLFRQAIAADPKLILAYTNLGATFRRMNMNARAIVEYKKALALAPDSAITLNDLGNSYRQAGDFEQAIECYLNALEIEPTNDGIHYNLGIALAADGQLNAARERYKEAIIFNPAGAKAFNNLANIYALQKDYINAIRYYTRAIQLDPELEEAGDNLKVVSMLQKEAEDRKSGIKP